MAGLRKLVLIGGGGTCSDVLAIITSINRLTPRYEVLGLLDDALAPGARRYGVPVLGPIANDQRWSEVWFVDCLGGPSTYMKREGLLRERRFDSERFETIVHPSVIMADDIHVGPGCIFFPNVAALSCVEVGTHVTVLSNTVLNHDVVLGDYSIVASGVNLSGNVTVGRGSYVGTGSCVRENVSIGSGALVGMGSVVTQDVASGIIVAGSPARQIKKYT